MIFFGFFLFFITTKTFNSHKKFDIKSESLKSMLCETNGPVGDNMKTIKELQILNEEHIFPILNFIVQTKYFRYFRVNLLRECKFWRDNFQCSKSNCDVNTCKENELPEGLKTSNKKCSEDSDLDQIDKNISTKQRKIIEQWKKIEKETISFCDAGDELPEAEYVDLIKNPERFTGYSGASAAKIWTSIYKENCFLDHKSYEHTSFFKDFNHRKEQTSCTQYENFFRLVSGLHTSVNTHLSVIYPRTSSNTPDFVKALKLEWDINVKELEYRFPIEKGPFYLKNMLFLYSMMLRALSKNKYIVDIIALYKSGDKDVDLEVNSKLKSLILLLKNDSVNIFNESQQFVFDLYSTHIKDNIRKHFVNISRIMDCVGCTKCRLWGKLQTQGIATGMKLLFSDEKSTVFLTRNEIVALINGLSRISFSIHNWYKIRQSLDALECDTIKKDHD